MVIEQTMSIEDNYVKSYHDLWVTYSLLKLFSPFGFKSKFWWSLFMYLIQIVSLVIWTYFNIYTKYSIVLALVEWEYFVFRQGMNKIFLLNFGVKTLHTNISLICSSLR